MSSPMSLPYADARGHTATLVRRVPIFITALLFLFFSIASTVTDVAAAFAPVDAERQQRLGVTLSAVPNVATVETPRYQESVPSRASYRQFPRHNPPTPVSVEDSPTAVNPVTSSLTTENAFLSPRGAHHENPPEPVEQFILGTLPGSMEGGAQASSRTPSQQHVAEVYTGRFMPKLRAIYAQPGKRDVLGGIMTEPSGTTARASPVASLQYRTIDVKDKAALDTTATSQELRGSTATTPMPTTSTVDGDVIPAAVSYANIPPSYEMPRRGVDHLSWKKSEGNGFVATDSTDAFLPIRIVGSGRTVVKFQGKAGHVISAVVQLKDNRYDKSVRINNCRGMYLEVELTSRNDASSTPHVWERPVDWSFAKKAPEEADSSTEEMHQRKGADDSSDPLSPQDRENNGPSSFWDFFAPMFDNSALCEVLQSVSMRVNEAPETQDYFVVIRSSLISPLEANAPYGNVPHLDPTSYTCDMNVYIIQEPAARQARMRLIFALILPLLVLVLPLPCTMWRADMLQQFMLDADFVESMWLLPLLVRKKTVQALKACVDCVIRFRTARQQRRLQNQLLLLHSLQQSTTATMQQAVGQQKQQPPQSGSAPLQAPNPSDLSSATDHTAQTQLLKPSWTSQAPNARLPLPQKEADTTSHGYRGPDVMPFKAPSGSGFGNPHGSTHHHHCRHHTDGNCSDVTVASPHLGCPSGVLEEDEGILSSMTSRTQVLCHCCEDTEESNTVCEAVTAVQVHVPPLVDATENLEDGHRRVRRARSSGYDLLFTTEECVHAEQSPASREQPQHTPGAQQSSANAATQAVPRRPREEEEAMFSGGGSVNYATREISQLMLNGAIPSLTSTHEAAVKSKVTVIAPGERVEGEEEEEEPFCRICRDGKEVAPLITPCACTGSVRFVHAICLDRWRIESAKRNLTNVNQCEICKETFRVEIGRSTLLWESSKHILNGVCLFFACFILIGVETTLTHTVLGEMSCSATYHRVAYRTMFRFEGLSLTIFVYALMVLLAVSANLIVYSWFRSRSDVEEYIAEMRIAPPFYTQRNKILILVVCFVLLAQVHAMGYLVKYFIYNTTHIAWNWETSPLMGGVLFSLFTAVVIPICSWGRQVYIAHITNRGSGATSATDVAVQGIREVDHVVPGANNTNEDGAPVPPRETLVSDAPLPPPPPSSPAVSGGTTSSPATLPTTREHAEQQQPEEDLNYTRHFDVPPEQRVIRAFEYCPPRRKLPKG